MNTAINCIFDSDNKVISIHEHCVEFIISTLI